MVQGYILQVIDSVAFRPDHNIYCLFAIVRYYHPERILKVVLCEEVVREVKLVICNLYLYHSIE